ncbi:MAG: radical SAM protein [Candidatus Gastranaerophilales bacterium]|nr:radical SAM protein [Candidatus Gastranaerophilales bacterium]
MEKFLYDRLQEKNPKLNVWFMYPAIESFALASLGFLSIFKMLDLDPELYVERIYSDTKIFEIPLDCLDCAGFSMSFEIDILTIIKMLKKYEIPLKSSDRDEETPLIFGGGPVLMANPLPFEEFFDFISVGEKNSLKTALDVLKEINDLSRDEKLKRLSELDGIYVPKYPKSKIKVTRDNLKEEITYTSILSEKSYFKDSFVIEIERGCPKMCNFCLASWINCPTRFVPVEKIVETIDFGLQYTDKLALMGAYVAGHPDFDKIIKHISSYCETRPIELSISSLRADLADEELIKTLVKCNQKTATIALEAGSQRLRDLIKKDLTEAQILNTLKTAQIGGLKGMKIYTMIGLPTEVDEDIDELISLVKKMKEQVKQLKSQFDITISTSTFIPKAHTPFENVERVDKKILEKRINHLKKTFHKMGVTFRPSSVDWDVIQSILSRYDKSLADLLIEVMERGGNLGAFKQVWKEHAKKGLLPSFDEASKLPFDNTKEPKWTFIDTESMKLKEQIKKGFAF